MNKIIFLICILLVLLFLSVGYALDYSDYIDTRTSAVCNGNVCRDYVFTCLNGEVVDFRAISGFVTFGDDWVDKRENKEEC